MADRRGTVALISGVARPPGIGRATALRLLRDGAACFVVDVVTDGTPHHTGQAPAELFAAVVDELRAIAPDRVAATALDASFDTDWAVVTAAAVERFGRLDVACALSGATGAGVGDGPLLDLTGASWQACVALNLTGPLGLLLAAARTMVAAGRGGALAVLSSQAARVVAPGAAALGAARAGLGHLVEALAVELGPHGIRCNAVAPLGVGPSPAFPNPGLLALAERESGGLDAWARERIPLGRMQSADETAAVIDFLTSSESSFVTGAVVPVTGAGR